MISFSYKKSEVKKLYKSAFLLQWGGILFFAVLFVVISAVTFAEYASNTEENSLATPIFIASATVVILIRLAVTYIRHMHSANKFIKGMTAEEYHCTICITDDILTVENLTKKTNAVIKKSDIKRVMWSKSAVIIFLKHSVPWMLPSSPEIIDALADFSQKQKRAK